MPPQEAAFLEEPTGRPRAALSGDDEDDQDSSRRRNGGALRAPPPGASRGGRAPHRRAWPRRKRQDRALQRRKPAAEPASGVHAAAAPAEPVRGRRSAQPPAGLASWREGREFPGRRAPQRPKPAPCPGRHAPAGVRHGGGIMGRTRQGPTLTGLAWTSATEPRTGPRGAGGRPGCPPPLRSR